MSRAQRTVIILSAFTLALMYLWVPCVYGYYNWSWLVEKIDWHKADRNFTFWVFGTMVLFLAGMKRREY